MTRLHIHRYAALVLHGCPTDGRSSAAIRSAAGGKVERSDFHTTAAQIAVGLAGFTGVSSAFSSRPTDVSAEIQAERLRGMIEAGLVAVIFSLLPLLLSDVELPEATLWRLASALYLVVWTVTFALGVRRVLHVLRGAPAQPRSWAAALGLVGALCFGSLVSGVIGFRPSSCYLFALLLQLILCGLFFYRVSSSRCGAAPPGSCRSPDKRVQVTDLAPVEWTPG
jgi:hypothetical protein